MYICGKCGYVVCLRCMGDVKKKCPKCSAQAAMVFDGRGLQSTATITSLESVRVPRRSRPVHGEQSTTWHFTKMNPWLASSSKVRLHGHRRAGHFQRRERFHEQEAG